MKLKITVHGVAYEVEVEVLDPGEGFAMPTALPVRPRAAAVPVAAPVAAPTPVAAGAGVLGSPVPGTVLEIKCKVGDSVAVGQEVLVLEAMKMHTSVAAPVAGRVKAVPVAVGDSVREGQTLVEFE